MPIRLICNDRFAGGSIIMTNTTITRRVLRVIPSVAAVVLLAGACGVTSTLGFATTGSAGMTPDQVAQYCKNSDLYVPEDPTGRPSWVTDTPKLIQLKKYTPVQLQPDVQLMISDYQALTRQDRVLPQVQDELDSSYKRLMDFRTQICEVH